MKRTRLIKEIKETIQEELSIADKVKEEASRLLERIKSYLNNSENEPESDISNTRKKTGSFKDNFEGINLTVSYVYYNFLTKKAFENAKGRLDFNNSNSLKISKKSWLINIKCYGISGSLDSEDLADSLQHEVEHIYQGIHGKPILNEPNQIYFNVQNSLSSKDDGIRKAAEIIYFSYDFEQDGFVNGLYAYLREKENPIPKWDDILDSEPVAWLNRVDENVEYLENEKENEQLNRKCMELFGKTIKQIILIGGISKRRMKTKIGKVLIKIRKDAMNEGAVFLIPKNGGEVPYVF